MILEVLLYEILIVLFSFLSFIFSGSETSIISADKSLLLTDREKNKIGSSKALFLIANTEKTLSLILIWNNIANITATALITYAARKFYNLSDVEIVLVMVLQTLFFLVFCEILPKIIARFIPNTYIKTISIPMYYLIIIFSPAISITLFLAQRIRKAFNLKNVEFSIASARDEISALFELGEKHGVIDENIQQYVSDILSLHRLTVSEVMTPIIDVVSVEAQSSIKEVVEIVGKTRFSRIPVYSERVDNIVGHIYYKDLLYKYNKALKIENIMEQPAFVPRTVPVFKLLLEMMRDNRYIVFIVNEYGGVDGLTTREDIIEEIVGEIQTRDHYHEELITKLNANRFSVSGNLDVDFFDRFFEINIEKKGFETVAGFMLYLFESVPKENAKIVFNNFSFIIEKATDRSIDRIIVQMPKK